ncbi:seven-hairpin glycosidase [Ceraceosorus guamensis]|uniref:alpha-1,2-Mannosidase n=1 Tax=Ceraceosorus guamensis TaxID=1522189 RepID=A0A316WBQ7_9BASI|nr:seven-hairpin glycosidase [Ceraceosorus guamensis]PWN46081.1 seven-hairpin glycosidase [Ceraceosorus guamensis]
MRLTLSSLLALSLALLLSVSSSQAVGIQSKAAKGDAARADAIKQAYRTSYEGYLTYARGQDSLLPLSKRGTGGFGNWGATMIDSLTTSYLMGFKDLFDESRRFVRTVDFTKTSQSEISIFETNIRYIGALLSAYELSGKQYKTFINQATKIGDRVLAGWVGNNDLPYNTLQNWSSGGKPKTGNGAIIAETGTLILELTRLSKYSGNATYGQHAVRAMKATINAPQIGLPAGLHGQGIDPATGKATDDYMTWGGGSDSALEYEIKYGQLKGTTTTWIPAWISTVKASVRYLITEAGGTAKKLTYLTDYSPSYGGQIPRGSHLGCFVGGNWILGGKLLHSQAIVDYGMKLTESCINTYTSSPTGIGPESFVYKAANGSTNGVRVSNEAFYALNGYDFESTPYILRPEVLESVFYAYRTTGDKKWQDLAWNAFQSIQRYCKVSYGSFASIAEVNNTLTRKLDDSESFLYAELFKYLYLTFSDPSIASLDKYVFNTEGHPFEQEKPNADYSSLYASAASLPAPLGLQKAAATGVSAEPTRTKKAPPLPAFSNIPSQLGDLGKDILKTLGDLGGGVQNIVTALLSRTDADADAGQERESAEDAGVVVKKKKRHFGQGKSTWSPKL